MKQSFRTKLRQMWVPKPFRLPEPEFSKEQIDLLEELIQLIQPTMTLAAATSRDDRAHMAQFLVDLGTGIWRIRRKIESLGRMPKEIREALYSLESTWMSMSEGGVEIVDHIGTVPSQQEAVIVEVRTIANLAREQVIDALKPTILLKGEVIQKGEVILGRPISGSAAEEPRPLQVGIRSAFIPQGSSEDQAPQKVETFSMEMPVEVASMPVREEELGAAVSRILDESSNGFDEPAPEPETVVEEQYPETEAETEVEEQYVEPEYATDAEGEEEFTEAETEIEADTEIDAESEEQYVEPEAGAEDAADEEQYVEAEAETDAVEPEADEQYIEPEADAEVAVDEQYVEPEAEPAVEEQYVETDAEDEDAADEEQYVEPEAEEQYAEPETEPELEPADEADEQYIEPEAEPELDAEPEAAIDERSVETETEPEAETEGAAGEQYIESETELDAEAEAEEQYVEPEVAVEEQYTELEQEADQEAEAAIEEPYIEPELEPEVAPEADLAAELEAELDAVEAEAEAEEPYVEPTPEAAAPADDVLLGARVVPEEPSSDDGFVRDVPTPFDAALAEEEVASKPKKRKKAASNGTKTKAEKATKTSKKAKAEKIADDGEAKPKKRGRPKKKALEDMNDG